MYFSPFFIEIEEFITMKRKRKTSDDYVVETLNSHVSLNNIYNVSFVQSSFEDKIIKNLYRWEIVSRLQVQKNIIIMPGLAGQGRHLFLTRFCQDNSLSLIRITPSDDDPDLVPNVMKKAVECEPSILFFDQCDAFFKVNSASSFHGHCLWNENAKIKMRRNVPQVWIVLSVADPIDEQELIFNKEAAEQFRDREAAVKLEDRYLDWMYMEISYDDHVFFGKFIEDDIIKIIKTHLLSLYPSLKVDSEMNNLIQLVLRWKTPIDPLLRTPGNFIKGIDEAIYYSPVSENEIIDKITKWIMQRMHSLEESKDPVEPIPFSVITKKKHDVTGKKISPYAMLTSTL